MMPQSSEIAVHIRKGEAATPFGLLVTYLHGAWAIYMLYFGREER